MNITSTNVILHLIEVLRYTNTMIFNFRNAAGNVVNNNIAKCTDLIIITNEILSHNLV